MKKVLFIIGTRPEAIKQAPVILEMQKRQSFNVIICTTGQHEDVLDEALGIFSIVPSIKLKLSRDSSSLSELYSKLLLEIEQVVLSLNPDYICVQGDTASALAGALVAFFHKIKILHIEAGLRTDSIDSPFPEELNRRVISLISNFNFCPTLRSMENLLKENVNKSKLFNVGNTVVDSVKLISQFASENIIDGKYVLITSHRRENQHLLNDFCWAINELAIKFPNIKWIFIRHYNPKLQKIVAKSLNSSLSNIYVKDPMSYIDLISLMKHAYFILTDSGGIQEEAPALSIPVFVLREDTERPEGIDAGVSVLLGTQKEKIINIISEYISNEKLLLQMRQSRCPYGDGNAAKYICDIIQRSV